MSSTGVVGSLGFAKAGGRRDLPFCIKWLKVGGGWKLKLADDIPYRFIIAGINEVLNRDGGGGFLAGSLTRACGFAVAAERIQKEITVLHFQEGSDSAVFKVTAQIATSQGLRTVSFCMNISRTPRLNAHQAAVFGNLRRLRAIDSRFIVEPFLLDKALAANNGERTELAVWSCEWLDGYTEVNMFNAGENYDPSLLLSEGFEIFGLRRVRLNSPEKRSFAEGIFEDQNLADAVAEEMVKVLALYYDPVAGQGICEYGINAGDFVLRGDPGKTFDLKLITAREIKQFPVFDPRRPAINAAAFIEELVSHRENSLHHPYSMGQREAERYAIFCFTPGDICRGLKKALIERHGQQPARMMLLQWLAAYKYVSRLMAAGYSHKEAMLRRMMVQEGLNQFLVDEGYPQRISVEI